MGNNQIRIIAETAFSHEGNLAYLKSQIREAERGGADFVKFQVLLNPDGYFHINHPLKAAAGSWTFDVESWNHIIGYTLERGLKIILLPLEENALKFCFDHESDITAVELHSVCFPDIHMHCMLRDWEKMLILGVGGYRQDEIQHLIVESGVSVKNLVLMHGFQSFPTNPECSELQKIRELKDAFGCTVGYADHMAFDDQNWMTACILSVALGSSLIEKHIVVQKGKKRTDFESAVDSKELLKLREALHQTIRMLGGGNLSVLNTDESKYRSRRKRPVAIRELAAGTILSPSDIIFQVCEGDNRISDIEGDSVNGRTLNRHVCKNEILELGVLK